MKCEGPIKLKVVFYAKAKHDTVFREKRKLKSKPIWLTEDLTVTKAKFAYLARQAVKKGHANSTWTSDRQINVQKTDSKPRCVNTISVMIEYLIIIPLLPVVLILQQQSPLDRSPPMAEGLEGKQMQPMSNGFQRQTLSLII